MRSRVGSLVVFLMGLLVFSSPAFAQIFLHRRTAFRRTKESSGGVQSQAHV